MSKADKVGTKPSFAFIAMPMDKDDHRLVDVLETIKHAAQRFGIVAERVDDTESNERITDRMLRSINSADFVIADLSNERPNVFFEAGYAEGRGKTPIYIARRGTPLHFDTKDYPIIFFHNMKELREGLQRRFDALSAITPDHNTKTFESNNGTTKNLVPISNVDCDSDWGTKSLEDVGERLVATVPGIPTQVIDEYHHPTSTIVEFSDRFSLAFPGVRGIAWFDDITTIAKRLAVLLKPPLRFANQELFWWWRGGKDMYIRKFEYVQDSHFLMDAHELNVRRVAAVNPGDYYQKFVYVETDADEPTGLYPDSARYVDLLIEDYGYASEEYGLLDKKIPVTRAEYDDGATIIDGEPVDVNARTELRVRYLTPYNFIIAPQYAPINNEDFNDKLNTYLNQLLRGENVFDDMCNAISCLRKRN